MKTKAQLSQDLATFTGWSDANPMKSVLINLTLKDLETIEREEARQRRVQAATAKAAAKAALPWYKRIFA